MSPRLQYRGIHQRGTAECALATAQRLTEAIGISLNDVLESLREPKNWQPGMALSGIRVMTMTLGTRRGLSKSGLAEVKRRRDCLIRLRPFSLEPGCPFISLLAPMWTRRSSS
jgi:hypothetical protein